MKRWFVAKLYLDPEEGRVPAVHRYTQDYRVWTNPTANFGFGQCAAPKMDEMQADPDIFILPDGSMDMSVGSIPAGVRTAMRSRLEAVGMSYDAVKATWTVRELLVYLQKQLQPQLTSGVESGDVFDRWG